MRHIGIGLRGFFTVELIDAATDEVIRKLHFKNLIVDSGMDFLGTSNAGVNMITNGYMGVGTGSTAPANSQTALVTEITPASTNRTTDNGGFTMTNTYISGTPDYWSHKRTFLFDTTQGNGTLAELAIFNLVSGGTMWCRQLLRDGGGSPITLTKTSSEKLRITYELQVEPLQAFSSAAVTISGTSYATDCDVASVNDLGGWGSMFFTNWWSTTVSNGQALETNVLTSRLGTIPAGTSASGFAVAAYGAGTFLRDVTITFNPATANFATGIGKVCYLITGGGEYCFQSTYTPKFAKDASTQLDLVLRLSWFRAS